MRCGRSEAHSTLQTSLVLAVSYGGALVVLLLTSSECNDQLSESALVDEETHGDDRLSGVLHLLLELA